MRSSLLLRSRMVASREILRLPAISEDALAIFVKAGFAGPIHKCHMQDWRCQTSRRRRVAEAVRSTPYCWQDWLRLSGRGLGSGRKLGRAENLFLFGCFSCRGKAKAFLVFCMRVGLAAGRRGANTKFSAASRTGQESCIFPRVRVRKR